MTVDGPTLDLIENALLNVRFEMDEVVRRAAMSPMIREQHDEFPMVCDRHGRMVVGQFGSYIPGIVERLRRRHPQGRRDPVQRPVPERGLDHAPQRLVRRPADLRRERHIGFASMFGHMMDVGGKVAGSQVNDATSIWEEGLRIPPVKIVEGGVLNRTALDVILNNSRTPDMNESDLMALIAGCRTAETRVNELCDRFGADAVRGGVRARSSSARASPSARSCAATSPRSRSRSPTGSTTTGWATARSRSCSTVWREGDVCHVDWTGTDAQAPGTINFRINDGLCKLFFGIYLIMAFDPVDPVQRRGARRLRRDAAGGVHC